MIGCAALGDLNPVHHQEKLDVCKLHMDRLVQIKEEKAAFMKCQNMTLICRFITGGFFCFNE